MLGWAWLHFLAIGLLAAMLGFTTVAGASFAIAEVHRGRVPCAVPGLLGPWLHRGPESDELTSTGRHSGLRLRDHVGGLAIAHLASVHTAVIPSLV